VGVLCDRAVAQVREWSRIQEDDLTVLAYRQQRV
jgi:hypothetical protein